MKPYFSHDEGARNDPKLVKVLMRLGQAGKGVYWDLVEMLYEQNGYLLLEECESYAFALRTDCDLIKKLIADFELFVTDGTKFWSETCLERMKMRDAKKLARAEAGAKGGKIKAEREAAAKALLEHDHSNATDNPSIATALPPEKLAIKEKEKKGNTTDVVEASPPVKTLPANPAKQTAVATTDPADEQHWSKGPLTKPKAFRVICERLGFLGIDFEHYRKQALVAAEDKNISRTIIQWTSWVRNFFEFRLQHGPLLTEVAALDLSQPTPKDQLPPVGTDCTGRHIVLPNTGDANMNRMFAANYARDFPNAIIHQTR